MQMKSLRAVGLAAVTVVALGFLLFRFGGSGGDLARDSSRQAAEPAGSENTQPVEKLPVPGPADLPTIASETESETVEGVGLTVAELRALHEQQEREFREATGASESAMLVAAPDGFLSRSSVAEILALHRAQEKEAASRSADELVPLPMNESGEALTVAELKMLHKDQEALARAGDPYQEMASPDPELEPGDNQSNPLGSVAEVKGLQALQQTMVSSNADQSPAPSLAEGGTAMTIGELHAVHNKQRAAAQ